MQENKPTVNEINHIKTVTSWNIFSCMCVKRPGVNDRVLHPLVIPVDHAPAGRTQGSLGWSHMGARTVQVDPGASREATAGDASGQLGFCSKGLESR